MFLMDTLNNCSWYTETPTELMDKTTAKTIAVMGMIFPPVLPSKSPRVHFFPQLTFFYLNFELTQFSTDNSTHDEEWSQDLNVGNLSPQEKLVDADRDHRPEATEDHPDWRRDEDEAGQVDVIVDGVDDGGEEELQRGSDRLTVELRQPTARP